MNRDQTVRFELDGKRHEVDLEDLTFDEWEDVERVTGPFERASTMTQLRGVIYIALQREDPTFSLTDLGQIKPAHVKEIDEPVVTLPEEVADARPPAVGEAPVSEKGSNGFAEHGAPLSSVAATTPDASGAP